ncbi:MAG: hypothetical protein IJ180_06505 [Bacteroidales bacterium]|nr:hypothetical protein [Bacteroidales bacterium]
MRKNKILLTLFILLGITKISYAQDIDCYYPLMKEAKSDYSKGKYEIARSKFKDVLIECDDCNEDYKRKEVRRWIDSCDTKISNISIKQIDIWKKQYKDSIENVHKNLEKKLNSEKDSLERKNTSLVKENASLVKDNNNLRQSRQRNDYYTFEDEWSLCFYYTYIPHFPISFSIGGDWRDYDYDNGNGLGASVTFDLGFKIHDYTFDKKYSDAFVNYKPYTYTRPNFLIGISGFVNLKYTQIGIGIGAMWCSKNLTYDPYGEIIDERHPDILLKFYYNPKINIFIPLYPNYFMTLGCGYIIYPKMKEFNGLTFSIGITGR